MDVGPGARGHLAELMDVRHHVMSEVRLDFGDAFEVDFIPARAELGDRLVRNHHSEFTLDLGQRDPQIAPGESLPERREHVGHLRGRVAIDQRMRISGLLGSHGFSRCRMASYCNTAPRDST